MTSIHPTALVHPSARLAANVTIGAYCQIEPGVSVGERTVLAAHAVVRSGGRIGADCYIDHFAVVGGAPQMRHASASPGSPANEARVLIGDGCVLREGVTVNLPSREGSVTQTGEDCLLMANSHVGHDCHLGSNVTLANNVMLAGHVTVGSGSFLGGGAGVHQYVRIGACTMIGGNASISYDVPPYALAAERNEIRGLNLVGIRRSKMCPLALADLKRAYHAVYRGPGDLRARAAQAQATGTCGSGHAGRDFLEFFVRGERGFARPART